ncbi:MAG: hypothetical protein RIS79_2071 [Verrucomicrobiota bacterium]|jgi:hypothetical protein
MATTQQDIEARLSYAYLHAVASHAGYVCRPATPDEDKEGIDAVVTAYGIFPGTWRTQVTINIQLKATIKTPADDGSHLSYFLQVVRRYDKLREDHREPVRLLVVLFLPEKHDDWLSCNEEQLVLKRCAYWGSLRNAPESTNGTGQTVKIPKDQILKPENLKALVERLALGNDIPSYLVP